ncbi:MAG: leucine--tRNA ligase [Patescibacteria group bacterium]
MKKYDHIKIEKKWQREWAKKKVYRTEDNSKKQKFYILDMFPYPSGEGLHVGHPKGYIATDIVSRMKRMQGLNVLHPMGFDAFGLPAENYAIETKTNPAIAVAKNVVRYKKQLEIIGFDYDWSREINTTDPKYYKWTQWIFLKLFERGLAYESFEPINWCPSCKTGLANEDVEDGKCERCGTSVEKRPMRQWVLKITDYADRLLRDLNVLDWPESIKESQRNWIGRSEGTEINFTIKDKTEKLKVFTTRPDTLFGVTYMVVAPEHKFVTELLEHRENLKNHDEVAKYVTHACMETEIERTNAKKEKTGVKLEGIFAINPANKEKVPVFVADYVLADYGTGAVMAVPAHDERDFVFAKKYKLPIKQVIEPVYTQTTEPGKIIPNFPFEHRNAIIAIVKHWKDDKYMALKWKKVAWGTFITGGVEGNQTPEEAAKMEIKEETGFLHPKLISNFGRIHSKFYHVPKKVNRFAHSHTLYFKLENDAREKVTETENEIHEVKWLTIDELKTFLTEDSHQHALRILADVSDAYVDEGILVNSGAFSGKDSQEVKKVITKSVGGKWVVKYKLKDWVFSRQRYWGEPFPIFHNSDKIIPVSEKDLPVVLPKVKSYEPTGTGESPLASIPKWVNVKVGVGKNAKMLKRETNTMPQWAGSSWYYLRYMDPKNSKALVDPLKEKYWNEVDFYVGGAEHATRHLIYARFWHKFLYDIGIVSTLEPFKKLQSVGLIMGEDGKKMSKRFGNIVNPDLIVKTYGADTLRLYEMFMGPFDQAIAWNTNGMIGSRRFLERVWKLRQKVHEKGTISKETEILLHKTIKKVTEDISSIHHNTAVSSMMILSNVFEKENTISKTHFEIFLKLLAPFAPHITEELWCDLGNKKSIHISGWPLADESKIAERSVTIVVQVNGKVRASFTAVRGTSKEGLEKTALDLPDVKKWIGDKKPKRIIVISDKLVSIVVA